MTDEHFTIPGDPDLLEDLISAREQRYNLKAGTEAKIIWQNSSRSPTEYAIVYLHGFKATHPEGDPVHKKVAEILSCNLYLARLQEHGLTDNRPLLNLTEEKLLQSARDALEIGKRLGQKIILMGTSTGGSLALELAGNRMFSEHIAALILYSPLIDFYDHPARLLRSRLIRSLLKIMPGKKFQIARPRLKVDESYIWYEKYSLQGALALGEFVSNHMHRATFNRITCPVFIGYYYKNRLEQDKVVSVEAIKAMFGQIRTDIRKKKLVNFPNANTHVICSSLLSGSVRTVIKETATFVSNHCQTAK